MISIFTARPARAASATSASRLNLPTRPRSRSFRRGCVTPRRLAASVWVTCHPATASLIAIIRLERSFMFAASVGVSSSASHTLSKTSMVIGHRILAICSRSRDAAKSSIRAGVREIRVRQRVGAFRVIYVATFPDAVYVLHAFEKKTQQWWIPRSPEDHPASRPGTRSVSRVILISIAIYHGEREFNLLLCRNGDAERDLWPSRRHLSRLA